jgi:DNA gyrase subunit A
MSTQEPPLEFSNVEPIEIQEEMERSFLDYAMSVIISRALPDVRDGLKPVHRRILWDMFDNGFTPARNHVKCARVTGDTASKFHPHGTGAIYEALARMAQDFSLRHPLIDGHGNFGSPDAGPAAERYTECRLATLAMQLMAGIEEETVDFNPNYDGSNQEPAVLPSRFPNLLVNGSQGIAVGMATNIPPHNLGEVIDAVTHLIDRPEADVDELMSFVKGPDFPTGAIILGRSGIIDAFRTGRGSIKMRAVAEIEELKGGKSQIVVTELPYQTNCSSIEERIAELVESGELAGVADVNDGSSGGKTRLIIDLKRDAVANVVLNNLYKHTQLQTTFSVNMVALVGGVPRTINLKQALQAYIDHQIEVITRRTQYRLDKAAERAHIVEGRIKALNVIDAIIAMIRASDDRAAARAGLMAEPFSFTEAQAEDILRMTLGQLTRLSRIELESELAELQATMAELQSILDDPVKLRGVIKSEMAAIRSEFANPRRSVIAFDPGDLNVEDLIEDQELVITLSKVGYVKAMPSDTFRTQARGGRGIAGAKLKDDDYVTRIITTTAHQYLLFFSNRGRVYRLKAHEIPIKDRSARGTAIVNLLPLAPDERIEAVIDARSYGEDRYLFFCSKQGQVKKTAMSEYDSSLRSGIIALNIRDDDELVKVIETSGSDDILIVSRSGIAIRFNESEVRPMGRAAAGVRGMKMKADDEVVSCDAVTDATDMLFVTDGGFGKRTKVDRFNTQGRGGQGVIAIKLPARRGKVIAAFTVDLDDEVLVITDGGVTTRIAVREISSQGRDATGVRVQRLDDGQSVASVAKVLNAGEADAES